MVNPMKGLDKEGVAKVQAVGSQISGRITVDHLNDILTLEMSSDDPQAKLMIKNILPQFADQMASMLTMFFSIKGRIVDVNKQKTP
jgi:hypothetical protein